MRVSGSGTESQWWMVVANESVEQVLIHEIRPNADIPGTIDPTLPPDSYFLVRIRASPLDAMKWAEQSNAAVVSMHHTSKVRLVLEVLVVGMYAVFPGG